MQNSACLSVLSFLIPGLFGWTNCFNAQAQQAHPVHRRAIREMIEEKLRINPDSLRSFLSNPQEYRDRHRSDDDERTQVDGAQIQAIANTKISTQPQTEMEVHAAVNPTDPDNIVCAAISPTSNPLVCPIYYTHDGGSTWQKSSFRSIQHGAKGTLLGGGDPVFAFDDSGTLYFTWIDSYQPTNDKNLQNMELYWVQSTDGGATFQRDETKDGVFLGKVVNQDYGDSLSQVIDKEWIMTDNSTSPYRGNLYVAALQTKVNEWYIRLRKKSALKDQFESEAVTALVPNMSYSQECSLDVDTLGRVHMVFCASLVGDTVNRGSWYWRLYDAVSADGGQSFESVNLISKAFIMSYDSATDSFLNIPVGAASADALPQVVCDKRGSASRPATNFIYTVWTASGTDSIGSLGMDVYFSRSTDGGRTWSTPFIVNDDAKEHCSQLYASIAVNEDGKIVVAWYDRRGDAADKKGHYYMAMSFDNGISFTPNFPITTQVTDFSKFTGYYARATGEYNQVVTTKTHAITFWGDGRSGIAQVYMAKVPFDSTLLGVETVQPIDNDWSLTSITPMPVHDQGVLSVQSAKDRAIDASLFALDGSVVYNFGRFVTHKGSDHIPLKFPDLSRGLYILRLKCGEQSIISRILID